MDLPKEPLSFEKEDSLFTREVTELADDITARTCSLLTELGNGYIYKEVYRLATAVASRWIVLERNGIEIKDEDGIGYSKENICLLHFEDKQLFIWGSIHQRVVFKLFEENVSPELESLRKITYENAPDDVSWQLNSILDPKLLEMRMRELNLIE